MRIEDMHFTGTIWRPPYEANSQLIQATIGCSHHSCKFCSLYPGIKFKISPKEEFEHDLKIIQKYQPKARRVFLVGANPFVLSYNRLLDLGFLIRKYLPECKSIGMFARVTDITHKSIEELKNLRHLGFNGITVGTESGDDLTLLHMNKKTTSAETIENLKKFEEAGIEYYVSYLTGLAGAGNEERNALATSDMFNQLHPYIISVVSLTIFPDTVLFQEIQQGLFREASEHERLKELRTFISNLKINTNFFANTVSNPVPLTGYLPNDKKRLINELSDVINAVDERVLKTYRKNLKSL